MFAPRCWAGERKRSLPLDAESARGERKGRGQSATHAREHKRGASKKQIKSFQLPGMEGACYGNYIRFHLRRHPCLLCSKGGSISLHEAPFIISMPPESAESAPETPLCLVCHKPFTPYRHWQVYCGKECRKKGYWLTHEIVTKPKIDGQVL